MISILLIVKRKFIAQLTKEKYREGSQESYGNLSADKNIKNRKYANNRNKNMSVADRSSGIIVYF